MAMIYSFIENNLDVKTKDNPSIRVGGRKLYYSMHFVLPRRKSSGEQETIFWAILIINGPYISPAEIKKFTISELLF